MKNYKVYFAAPWFTEAQEEREERLKKKLRELGFDVFSPKEDCNITGTFADPNVQKKVFDANISNIDNADILFAVTDGKLGTCTELDKYGSMINAIDSGTMIESGYAYNNKRKTGKPYIVYYAETLGNGKFNLMLAQSSDIVITKYEDMDKLPEMIEEIISGKSIEYKGMIE